MKNRLIKLCSVTVLLSLLFVGCNSGVLTNSSTNKDEGTSIDIYLDAPSLSDKTEDDIIALYGEPESIDEWKYERFSDGLTYAIRTLSYTKSNGEYWEFSFNNDLLQRISIDDCNISFDKKSDVMGLFGCKKYSNTETTDTNAALRYTNCGVSDLWAWSVEDNVIKGIKISYSDLFK